MKDVDRFVGGSSSLCVLPPALLRAAGRSFQPRSRQPSPFSSLRLPLLAIISACSRGGDKRGKEVLRHALVGHVRRDGGIQKASTLGPSSRLEDIQKQAKLHEPEKVAWVFTRPRHRRPSGLRSHLFHSMSLSTSFSVNCTLPISKPRCSSCSSICTTPQVRVCNPARLPPRRILSGSSSLGFAPTKYSEI